MSKATDLDPARLVAEQLRRKLDAAALEVLRSGRDWGEGPITFDQPDPFSTASLFDPVCVAAEAKGGPVAPDWVPPSGWRLIRHADWVAAGRPGELS